MNMKKHVLLVLLLGLTTSFCYSQVKVSVQGGAGFSGITKDKNYKADLKTAPNISINRITTPVNGMISNTLSLSYLASQHEGDHL